MISLFLWKTLEAVRPFTQGAALDFEQQRNQKNEDNGRGWHTEDLSLKEAGHSSAPIAVGSPRCGLSPRLPMAYSGLYFPASS